MDVRCQTTNNNLEKYNEREIKQFENGKVKIVQNQQDIRDFINNAKRVKSNAKLYFGKLNDDIVNKLKKLFKLDLNNYNVSLKADNIRHIINIHGKNTEYLRGQVPIVDCDFELIPEIILNYDSVILGKPTKEGKPVLIFIKQIEENYYLMNYISDKSHNLEVQMMWKMKKNSATTNNIRKNPVPTSKNE